MSPSSTEALDTLIHAARAWMAHDPDPVTRDQTLAMVEARDLDALASCFGQRLGFGTAGIRGPRGPGPGRLNRAVARQVAYAVGRVLLQDPHLPPRVVIGFDGRHGSAACARDAAAVLAGLGLQVHLFDEVVPTPVLAHATTWLSCGAGVMVTASHNPPADNGIKVYQADGAQIVPPLDRRIQDALAHPPPSPDLDLLRERGQVLSVPPAQLDAYVQAVLALRVRPGRGLKVVYTAMHGVGWPTLRRVLLAAGHDEPVAVPAQRDPDGDFPTVALPNPEEKGALDLAFALADREGADLVLANDPDADRLAVALREGERWRRLTGDEVGLLLAEELLAFGHPDPARGQPLVATTIVSSSLLADIAAAHGAACRQVLTGFKWLAEAARSWPGPFVLGYEEALGYCVGEVVRDKDGISAALVLLDLAAACKAQGRTLLDALDDLARRHGAFLSSQVSLVLPGADGLARIQGTMAALRAQPPAALGGMAVRRVRDFSQGGDLPKSDVLAFDLEAGGRVLARPSGTEPKLKLYLEVREPLGPGEEPGAARARAGARLATLEAQVRELVER
ncbi:phospho-sugar mutase [Myxococcota bacterium]|nr:phospho-sugar mutase [Myxococcota bacterium]